MMEERFTPQLFIEHYTRWLGIRVEEIGVAPTVVITWGSKVVRRMAESVGAQPCPHWMYSDRQPFFTGEVAGQRVSFALTPVGAAGTIMMMEEMIACGARRLIGLGWAGSLQPNAPVGTFLIPTTCVREEGTSFHYLPADAVFGADSQLADRLESSARAHGAEVQRGPHWTIDAPYRELRSKIEAYRQQGILGVDMETSAMYALGQYRGVAVCNLLVVSDELWDEWNPAWRTPPLTAANELAEAVVLAALAEK
jgi:uridine phosphorylase